MEEYVLIHGDCENNEKIIAYAQSLDSVKAQLIDYIHSYSSEPYAKEHAIMALLKNDFPINSLDSSMTELYFTVSDYVKIEKA